MSDKTYPLVSAQCSTLCRKLTRSSAATKVKELMERNNGLGLRTNPHARSMTDMSTNTTHNDQLYDADQNARSMTDMSTNTTHNDPLYDAYMNQVESWEAICRFQTTIAHELHVNHHINAEARFRQNVIASTAGATFCIIGMVALPFGWIPLAIFVLANFTYQLTVIRSRSQIPQLLTMNLEPSNRRYRVQLNREVYLECSRRELTDLIDLMKLNHLGDWQYNGNRATHTVPSMTEHNELQEQIALAMRDNHFAPNQLPSEKSALARCMNSYIKNDNEWQELQRLFGFTEEVREAVRKVKTRALAYNSERLLQLGLYPVMTDTIQKILKSVSDNRGSEGVDIKKTCGIAPFFISLLLMHEIKHAYNGSAPPLMSAVDRGRRNAPIISDSISTACDYLSWHSSKKADYFRPFIRKVVLGDPYYKVTINLQCAKYCYQKRGLGLNEFKNYGYTPYPSQFLCGANYASGTVYKNEQGYDYNAQTAVEEKLKSKILSYVKRTQETTPYNALYTGKYPGNFYLDLYRTRDGDFRKAFNNSLRLHRGHV